MGKRAALLALVLALCLPAWGLAGANDSRPDMSDEGVMSCLVRTLGEWEKELRKPLQIGAWYYHPLGFAFEIPDDMEVLGRYKGATVMLMEEERGATPYRTTISIGVSNEDASLADMTEEMVSSAYKSVYRDLRLLSFDREAMYGEDGICLSYLFADTQQMYVEQCMFNKDGHCYVFVLTVENRLPGLLKGLEQFEAFRQSLLFVETPEKETGIQGK